MGSFPRKKSFLADEGIYVFILGALLVAMTWVLFFYDPPANNTPLYEMRTVDGERCMVYIPNGDVVACDFGEME